MSLSVSRDSICRTFRKASSRPRSRTLHSCAFVSLALCLLAGSLRVEAADLSVAVVGRDGHGVYEVVVTATRLGADSEAPPPRVPAVMDQKNLSFVPRVLVVAAGTNVDFPNNDSVSHQVYSFSEAKHFQLPLYKGTVHPPINFEKPGLVVLGCNIHDSMIAYIYVTDARYFGATAADGTLQLKGLAAGDYRVAIWSPFIADDPNSLVRTVHLDGSEDASLRVQLTRALRAQPEPKPRRGDWEY